MEPINEDIQCPICREDMDNTAWQCQQCKKRIHAECIMNAVENDGRGEQRCPLCRTDITESLRSICGSDMPDQGREQPNLIVPMIDILSMLSRHMRERSAVPIVPGYCMCMHILTSVKRLVAGMDSDEFNYILAYVMFNMQDRGTTLRRTREALLYNHRTGPTMNLIGPGSIISFDEEKDINQFMLDVGERLTDVKNCFEANPNRVAAAGQAHENICTGLRDAFVWLRLVTPCSVAPPVNNQAAEPDAEVKDDDLPLSGAHESGAEDKPDAKVEDDELPPIEVQEPEPHIIPHTAERLSREVGCTYDQAIFVLEAVNNEYLEAVRVLRS